MKKFLLATAFSLFGTFAYADNCEMILRQNDVVTSMSEGQINKFVAGSVVYLIESIIAQDTSEPVIETYTTLLLIGTQYKNFDDIIGLLLIYSSGHNPANEPTFDEMTRAADVSRGQMINTLLNCMQKYSS